MEYRATIEMEKERRQMSYGIDYKFSMKEWMQCREI